MKKWISRSLLLAFVIQGVVVVVWAYFINGQIPLSLTQFTLSYKAAYSGLIIVVFLITLSAAWFFYSSGKYRTGIERLTKILSTDRTALLIITLMVLGSFVAGQMILQTPGLENRLQFSFLRLTKPIWFWLILVSAEIILLTLIVGGWGKKILQPPLVWFISILLFLVAIILGLSYLGYGYMLGKGKFDVAGNPLLGYQVLLALVGVLILAFLGRIFLEYERERTRLPSRILDILLVALLFLGTFLAWNQVPLSPNAFIDQPRPPNYELYPDSDALLYDRTAQSLLASGRFQTYLSSKENYIGLRPLLTTAQAAFHALGGLGYREMLPFQVLAWAWLPVLIYFFGKQLHTRTSGLLAAVLVIIRNRNGQLLPNMDAGVHAKMALSEIPMIIGVVFFLILLLKRSRSKPGQLTLPLLSGGVLGLTMLIRPEVIIFFPLALIIYWFKYQSFGRIFLRSSIFLLVGLILAVSPWIWRNYRFSGEVYIDRPGNRLDLLGGFLEEYWEEWRSGQFQLMPTEIKKASLNLDVIQHKNPETGIIELHGIPFVQSVVYSQNGKQLGEEDEEGRVLDHLVNNLIQSLIFLPSEPLMLNVDYISKLTNGLVKRYYDGVFYSPQKYVKRLPFWWKDWDGGIPSYSIIMLVLNIAIISVGLSAGWRYYRRGVWTSSAAFLIFIFLYTFIQQSGGRVVQKIDWLVLVFYSIGLIELSLSVLGWRSSGAVKKEIHIQDPQVSRDRKKRAPLLIIVSVIIFLVGSLPPLVEYLKPNAYTKSGKKNLVDELFGREDHLLTQEEEEILRSFLDEGGEIFWGRGLYPRYFESGENPRDTRNSVIGGLEREGNNRFEFFLSGADNLWGVQRRDSSPDFFPHGSSVLAFGCRRKGNIDALVLFLISEEGDFGEVYWREGDLENISGCPLPWPDQE